MLQCMAKPHFHWPAVGQSELRGEVVCVQIGGAIMSITAPSARRDSAIGRRLIATDYLH